MEMKSKFFPELTTRELYEILKARAEIFVVEQNCVYQDLDDMDYQSLHVFFEEDGAVTAYLRAYEKGDNTVQMGRVLTRRHGTGLGGKLLREGIAQVRKRFNPERFNYSSAGSLDRRFPERMDTANRTDFHERSGLMQTATTAKKPRKQAISGRFRAGRTYRGRIKDDHKIERLLHVEGF